SVGGRKSSGPEGGARARAASPAHITREHGEEVMMRWLMIPVLALAVACSAEPQPPQDNPVELLITPEIPAVGQEAVLTLRNGSTAPVGYNLCTSTLMRHNGSEWEPVPSDRVCTMELRVLAPGEEDQFTVAMPAELAPGSYRFETT